MAKKGDDERTLREAREILASFQYPDDVKRTKGMRNRRTAKREHREEVRRNTKEWVREQRRRDPIRPAAALIVVAAVLAIGAGTRYLWPGLLGGNDHQDAKPAATATPTPGVQDDAPATSSSTPSATPSSSAAVDLSDPDHVAQEALRLYLTRNPPQDGDHSASVLRAAPYMTPALVENLASQDDPSWEKLVSRGGVATVSTVKAGPADSKLPANTPIRVWRKVTAKVDVKGYTDYSENTVVQAELTNGDGKGWHVSRIVGL
ncbi:hypothetical protein OG762_51750 (plasmid) [Streptomyces sp. NBC_01136]|uniref:hypothetical protein n=1 Tax=Streptomyces sp. NBC_01136 TaxID=2903754 RepID=UPI002F919666|nr:hypothetical protein OG762_51750 [Streptomyces sp. NBC_01136]